MSTARPVVHLVDDDASLRSALGGLLRAAGYDARNYTGSWHEWSRDPALPVEAAR